jgi:hypothetical protein
MGSNRPIEAPNNITELNKYQLFNMIGRSVDAFKPAPEDDNCAMLPALSKIHIRAEVDLLKSNLARSVSPRLNQKR